MEAIHALSEGDSVSYIQRSFKIRYAGGFFLFWTKEINDLARRAGNWSLVND